MVGNSGCRGCPNRCIQQFETFAAIFVVCAFCHGVNALRLRLRPERSPCARMAVEMSGRCPCHLARVPTVLPMDEHYLQSPTNPVVKDLVRLQRRSGRQEQQQFLVEGLRAVDGFIAQGWVPVHYVLADEQAAPEHWPEALIYRLSKPAWSKVATTVNPSGIAAVFALPAIQRTVRTWPSFRRWFW